MIRYIELTAPEKGEFRQAKIVSIEVSEGQKVDVGDTLFMVQSGSKEIPLPATKKGRVIEIIAFQDENISVMTPLILLETEVEEDSASNSDQLTDQPGKKPQTKKKAGKKKTKAKASKKAKRSKTTKKKKQSRVKKHEQQQLDLTGNTPPREDAPVNNEKDQRIELSVPDIGADAAKVVDILVNIGDTVKVDDPVISLESDKASMDMPSTHDGIVDDIHISVDDDVSEGDVLLTLRVSDDGASEPTPESSDSEAQPLSTSEPVATTSQTDSASEIDITIPDIGGDSAKVVEVLVNVGDQVSAEDPVLALESDKASMDLPAPQDGVISAISVKVDDTVSEGDAVIRLSVADGGTASSAPVVENPVIENKEPKQQNATPPAAPEPTQKPISADPGSKETTPAQTNQKKSYATPSIRRFARELGVDLSQVTGSLRKGRISKDDVKQFVKQRLTQGVTASSSGSGIPAIPDQDFAKFGPVEELALNRIKQLTATNLHRAWVNIPHVTHHDECNAKQIEVLRKGLKEDYAKEGLKISPLVFILKSCVDALKEFPTFNSSLHSSGQHLIIKHYYHIGIAVDTPNGLVVPVIRDVDKKDLKQLSLELADISERARNRKLTPKDLQGATFSISSLGGIGGRFFTPVVNSPEVAILGVARTKISPEWNGQEFVPTPMLPLSLSYDHRVIDGAEAARFSSFLCERIAQFSLA